MSIFNILKRRFSDCFCPRVVTTFYIRDVFGKAVVMKYIFASDIHGSAYYAKKTVEVFEESGADRLILVGDLLYHGPRNALPKDYNPQEVFTLLNKYADRIYAVRGNCDAEVDQMVLDFPMMSDYIVLNLNGINFFISHGHIYGEDNLPKLKAGDVFVFGHIHLPIAKKEEGIYILNPGSTSIPKGGNVNSYAILDGSDFKIMSFDKEIIKEISLG